MTIEGLPFKEQVEITIKNLANSSNAFIVTRLALLKENLQALEGSQTKIVRLSEHRKIKLAHKILTEVLKHRQGWTTPIEPISNKKSKGSKSNSGKLKIVSK